MYNFCPFPRGAVSRLQPAGHQQIKEAQQKHNFQLIPPFKKWHVSRDTQNASLSCFSLQFFPSKRCAFKESTQSDEGIIKLTVHMKSE